jgi:hypothetical protein
MTSESTILLTVAGLCFLWSLAILAKPRRRHHYWLDPEPPLAQRRCPSCDRAIFYAKTTEGKILTLDASVPIYVQVRNEQRTTRVCPVAAYIEHSTLCKPAPTHYLSTNGRTHHED